MLKQIRKKNGLTQDELADKLNVTQQLVSCWELKTRIPRTKNLKKLASVLNVSVEEILECFE